MYEQSSPDCLLCYLHHRSARRAVNHYCDNAITLHKACYNKNARESEVMNAAITDMQMRVSVMLLRLMQIHEGVS